MKEAIMLFIVFLFLASMPKYVYTQQSQPQGFLSIDCGQPDGVVYQDTGNTGLTYVSDAGYVGTGINFDISTEYVTGNLERRFLNLRSFPEGNRNCYNLPANIGSKYLIRAHFMYGNYDGKRSVPTFDLYLGAEKWATIDKLSTADSTWWVEAIAVATKELIWVCLVDTGLGTPFISSLESRVLKNSLYAAANATQFIVLLGRRDAGSPDGSFVRYPKDPYDRIWSAFTYTDWSSLVTISNVDNSQDDGFEAPSEVMRTAAIPLGNIQNITFYYTSNTLTSFLYIHFAEVEKLAANESRQFWIYLDGKLWYNQAYAPLYLSASTIYNTNPLLSTRRHDIKITPSPTSTHLPIFNGLELFDLQQLNQALTLDDEIEAIMDIKSAYGIKSNWMGDPCVPSRFAWKGLTCSYLASNPAKIISLNLSSKGLQGAIPLSVGNLKSLQYLDLSNNSLSGPLPGFLADMTALKLLNVASNNITGSIPSSLQERNRTGNLSLSVSNNPGLCTSQSCNIETANQSCLSNSCKKNGSKVLVLALVGSAVVLVVIVGLFILYKVRQRWQESGQPKTQSRSRIVNQPNISPSTDDGLLPMKEVQHEEVLSIPIRPIKILGQKNKRYTYSEIMGITNHLARPIGKGGFGTVYHGLTTDGTQVAVKILSSTSTQGPKEFEREAELLLVVYHKNLAPFIGYCDEGNNKAIVYEYMKNGNLRHYLLAAESSASVLNWERRLHIAVDVAQGLEYLHNGCRPPIIHRDVKTTNILLNDDLEAKLADFGLSRAFPEGNLTHVWTEVMGTPGYLDPEYYETNMLTEKSDVYSFGVVLLELVTGRPPILPEKIHIIQWVNQLVERGNINDLIDLKLEGKFDQNSAWKVLGIAMQCIRRASVYRPTMSGVLVELKECLSSESFPKRAGGWQRGAHENESSGSGEIGFRGVSFTTPGPLPR